MKDLDLEETAKFYNIGRGTLNAKGVVGMLDAILPASIIAEWDFPQHEIRASCRGTG